MQIEDASFYRGEIFSGHEDPRYSDREFINTELHRAPHWARSRLLAKYSCRYDEILQDHSIVSHFRENIARRECNTRLRQAVDNIKSGSLPPISR